MIDGARLAQRIDALAAFSDDEGALTRLTLTPAHKHAAALVAQWMREAGMQVAVDPLGTVVGRLDAASPNAKLLLIGSHIDTVRNAGRFDGVFGVVAAIAAVERLHAEGARPPMAIEVLAFGDEEGVRFPVTLTGSRAVAGVLEAAALDSRDHRGLTRREALRTFGAPAGDPLALARDPARVMGYLELHIEQGPVLEARGLSLGIVTAINGATRGAVLVTGLAGHAGTLPMAMRRDALAAAAEIVLAVEAVARAGQDLVATVGVLDVPHAAINSVAGAARLSLDLRSPSDAARHAALAAIEAEIAEIARRRGVAAAFELAYETPATLCDASLMERLEKSCAALGRETMRLPSGAGHDAMSFRGRIPIAMLFARSRGGLSHHPDEYSDPTDMAAAADVLHDVILKMGETA